MCEDCIKIGSIIISKQALDALMILASVVIGGFVTYLTTRTLEFQKWKIQKKDKEQEELREALAIALEWITPMQNSLIYAESLLTQFLKDQISIQEFSAKWPNLLSELMKKEIPARLKVHLPSKIQVQANSIAIKVGALGGKALLSEPIGQKESREKRKKKLEYFLQEVAYLQEITNEFQIDLAKEYKNTFD